ncbi:ATPase, histidine kinase-, DNA gyrase B-, and HSP90-like domain protein [Synechococcus sp. PCC 7335]|uniref:sensor histidine kinase n=1 Tax=Synechococcus sp. (strain ATCC 29403 / PCC 7335) TaxID=91464 RepID=UPI00017EBF8B|nr:ATP-binding protein [Synechococcus sp. PCC 7335]EDX84131.1 ATPase, histidine kinase-, DNA gyrase B-, and HSP90-like domain protein [Synechococcus sp. PCC 7335]
MFQTTRRRLALWYAAVTAIVLLLFSIGVYTYVRNTLIDRVDDTLNHVVEVVERSLIISNDGRVNIEASFRNSEEASEDDRIDLEWFGPEGNLQWTTFSKSPEVPLHVNPDGETIIPPQGLAIRQITQRINADSHLLGYLRVSHPWFEVSKPSRQLIVDLGFGIAVMITTVAGIGWFLSGLAMAPIRTSYQQLKQFTADASHELRNPIAVIQTNVQVALADPDEQFQRAQLEVIERLTRRLGRLVDDLLFIARQESGLIPMRREAVELVSIIEDVVEEQQAIAREKDLTLTYAHPKNRIQTKGDRDQLTRLFTNLIANAIQYTPAGKITIDLSAGTQQATITITDTGIGIPTQDLSHIFDRFYRVDPARSRSAGGSGLGLAIAKIIVENHHGQLTLTSQSDPVKSNQGTIATVLLPVKTLPFKKAEALRT